MAMKWQVDDVERTVAVANTLGKAKLPVMATVMLCLWSALIPPDAVTTSPLLGPTLLISFK